MRRGSIAAIFFGLCILVSLRGGVEVEHQTFIVSMGVDEAADGGVTVTLVLPSANAGGKTEEKGGGAYHIVSATASGFADALLVLRAIVPRDLNFSQLLQVVVAEPLARGEGFAGLLDSLLATPRLNQSAVLAVSLGPAEAFLKTQLPFLGVRLSAGIQTSLAIYSELGNVPTTMLGDARRGMVNAWQTPLLPLVAVNETDGASPVPAGDPLDSVAGELPQRGGAPAEYLGAAVVAGGRMRGVLSGSEMELISFVMGKMEEIPFSIDGHFCRLRQHGKPSLHAALENGVCTLSLSASADAYPTGGQPVDAQAAQQKLAAAVRAVLEKLCALGADPVGFEGRAVRGAASLAEWNENNWEAAYRAANLEVNISVIAADAL